MTYCTCGNPISPEAAQCRSCAQDASVKYMPDEETVWATAKALREAWMFGDGSSHRDRKNNRDVKLVGGRPRGGVMAESDEAEKAWRAAQAKAEQEKATSLEIFTEV